MINFPNNPTEGQVEYLSGKRYQFTNGSWTVKEGEVATILSGSEIKVGTADIFVKTIQAPTVFTVSSVPPNLMVASFIMEIIKGGAHAITWFPGTKWDGDTPPTLAASGVTVIGFYTRDGGVTWRAFVMAKSTT